jgi:enoyl-CoA hydratase
MSSSPESKASTGAASGSDDAAHFRIEPLPDGAVFRLTRPAKLNAITRPILLGLADCLDALQARGARLLVITGEGERAFCAGTDLAETREMSEPARLDKSAMARELFVRLSRSRVLSVAAINGLAYGGGLELAMACTLRIAAAHATVSLPEIKLGLLPAYGGTQFLTALVGASRALDLMLTGRQVGADEALAMGLVNRVAGQPADLLAQAIDLGRQVTRFSRPAVDGIRRCVAAAGPQVSDAGLALEDAVVREVFVTANAREGVAAFLEKRPPRFTDPGG